MLVSGENLVSEGQQEKQNAIAAEKGEIIPFEVDTSKPFEVLIGSFSLVYESVELAKEGINLGHAVQIGYSTIKNGVYTWHPYDYFRW